MNTNNRNDLEEDRLTVYEIFMFIIFVVFAICLALQIFQPWARGDLLTDTLFVLGIIIFLSFGISYGKLQNRVKKLEKARGYRA